MRRALAGTALAAVVLASAPLAPGHASGSSPAAPARVGDVAEHAPASQRAGRASVERKVVRLTNKRRVAHGCEPLRLRKSLRRAARRHSDRMADARELSHQLPGEPSLARRVENAGYTGWTALGENIAAGQPTARAVVRAWMRSSGHRRNILDCDFEHIGVGVVGRDGVRWWTQDLGAR